MIIRFRKTVELLDQLTLAIGGERVRPPQGLPKIDANIQK